MCSLCTSSAQGNPRENPAVCEMDDDNDAPMPVTTAFVYGHCFVMGKASNAAKWAMHDGERVGLATGRSVARFLRRSPDMGLCTADNMIPHLDFFHQLRRCFHGFAGHASKRAG